jgi:hypothetical protein
MAAVLPAWMRRTADAVTASPLRLQVALLAADHARRDRPRRREGDQSRPRADPRRRKHAEGQRLQAVARQDRRRLVEGHVAGRPAPTQHVVIHRRQIVVDQAVGVDHLDRGTDATTVSRATARR